MNTKEELELYKTTTAWAYHFLLGLDRQLDHSNSELNSQSKNLDKYHE